MFTLPTHPSRMLEDFLERGLIKRIQGIEYGPNEEKPYWYKESAFCRYHQVKGHHTSSYFSMRKISKQLVDNGMISYENDIIKVKYQEIPNINIVNMIIL